MKSPAGLRERPLQLPKPNRSNVKKSNKLLASDNYPLAPVSLRDTLIKQLFETLVQNKMATPETIRQILNAAGEVFAAKGFQATTIREICAKAGANLAAINYHFGDKERLYIEAVKNARNVLEEGAPLPANVEHADPEVALQVFIRALANRMLTRHVESWRHELLVREFMNPSRACEEMMQESIAPTMERLYAIIRRLLPPEVPSFTVRQLGFSIISQCAYYRLQDRVVSMLTPPDELAEHFTPDVLADHITRFSLAAITAYDAYENPSQVSS